MKILVVSNLYPPDVLGGYEMGCRQVVDALRRQGHDVYVLTATPRVHHAAVEAHIGRRLKLSDVYDQYSMWKVSSGARKAREIEATAIHAFNVNVLGQVAEEFEPDVVYFWNLLGLGGLGLIASAQHLGLPWVMHLMDAVPSQLCSLRMNSNAAISEVAGFFSRICRGRFICCSRTTVEEIRTAGLDITDRTAVIPNWINTHGSPNRSEYCPDGTLRMISAGSFGLHKGTQFIIESARILRDRGHGNFSIDLYGMGSDIEFRTAIQSSQLDMVHLLGSRTQAELDRLYPQYDVFLFPTWEREPFAFAPMEAMAHGCVVVMSNISGNAEWFMDGRECLKVERNSVALADGIESILKGEVDLPRIGQRASRSVRKWFPLSRVIPQIETQLTRAIESNDSVRHSLSETNRIAQLVEKMAKSLVYETAA